jgi:hypothetical protein
MLAGGIYTCCVNLTDFDLVPGNVVNIRCGTHTVKVNIAATEPQHVKLAWINEWNCPEIFPCSGYLEITNESDQQIAKYAIEGKERSVVLDVSRPQKIKVNTGFIDTRAEVDWLHKILDAKLIYVEINGEWVEVVRAFKNLPFYETRNFLDSYELIFDKALV